MDKVYFFYRLSNFFFKIKLVPFAIIIRIFMRIIFSCDISYKTRIGKGTKFPHMALGVTIHQDAIIGENCQIMQNVTIGGRSGIKILPTIGKNVLIGANAVIIGNVNIGNNAKIGAGSVVVHDVKENEVVAGVPARHVKFLEEC